MSRNGQYGQGRPPQRRGPAENDPYAPQWQQPGGYPDPNYANGGQQGYHYPPEPEPYGYPQNGGGGLDRFAPQNGAAPYQQDPRGYDLGSYMPNGAQGYPAQEPMQYPPQQQQGYAETDAEYDDGLDGEDESRGGRRWMVIAIALVGAIGLGGGLAYTYKMLFTNGSGRAPFVRNVEPPNKVKPVTGGRENAQVDKKLFTRLGEDSGGEVRGTPTGNEPEGQQADGSGDAQVGGPRPVRIIPIQPGGGPSTTGSVDSGARPGGGSQMVTIPGLTIDTGGAAARSRYPQQGAQQQAMQQQGSQQQGLQQQGSQQQGGQLGAPVRIAALPQQQSAQQQGGAEPVLPPKRPIAIPTTPTTTPTTPTTSSIASAVQMAPKAPVPKKEALAATSASNTPVSSGYVAVLSSKKSRMDAMKAYASLDQKYRDMLASSTFDVQEADLGDKGIWYRAVIGPPRSYEGAKKLCDDLKAAGHQDCWPARY
jgi:hypothetical protein